MRNEVDPIAAIANRYAIENHKTIECFVFRIEWNGTERESFESKGLVPWLKCQTKQSSQDHLTYRSNWHTSVSYISNVFIFLHAPACKQPRFRPSLNGVISTTIPVNDRKIPSSLYEWGKTLVYISLAKTLHFTLINNQWITIRWWLDDEFQ